MSRHEAHIVWSASSAPFTYETYDRAHSVAFPGGASFIASAAADFRGDPSHPNPEEMLVAAASSCHMLTFLAIAARKRIEVTRYEDAAVGYLEPNEEKRLAVTRIELAPKITFAGVTPSADELATMHELAHRNCFIAQSIRASVTVLPTDPIGA